jgi:hypothetical protein
LHNRSRPYHHSDLDVGWLQSSAEPGSDGALANMGLDFSFSVIAKSAQVDLLLKELASRVCEKDARRLIGALPWKPAIRHSVLWESGARDEYCQGIAGLTLEAGEHPNLYCLSFLFPPDAILVQYTRNNRGTPTVGDRIAIGCVWTSLYVGTEFALLKGTAATTGMSVLFQSSSSVKSVWLELARRSLARALFFDTEDDHEWLLLHPQVRTVTRPYDACFWSPDFVTLRIDEYCWEMLHLAHLTS